ncbi:hypothetical protein E2C01_055340 [Portunus trituberculatus]|uniref:Uncharacterized protein n=1 Tax=Portunus trituberculatus TaxID=210409 RepID=A0A5B7GMG5_PORTR|nr:hypothetical protein [Portunus trituberculatus]
MCWLVKKNLNHLSHTYTIVIHPYKHNSFNTLAYIHTLEHLRESASRSASLLSSSPPLLLSPLTPAFMLRKYCPQRVRPASFFSRFSLARLTKTKDRGVSVSAGIEEEEEVL